MMHSPLILFILFTLVLGAIASCAPEDARPIIPATELRDSAGIRIVENARPPEGSRLGWRIGPEPTVSIGGLLWTVFDPEGQALGFVETPDGLEIDEIGEDYILGWVEDELGVESVQLWPLERAR